MTNRSLPSSAADLNDCASLLASIQREFQTAVHSICNNALQDFELSLWRQEMLCGLLKRSVTSIRSSPISHYSPGVLEKPLAGLKADLERYQRVVLRCARTTAVLQELSLLYCGGTSPYNANKLPSYSCEV